jgi:signal transduction histidine kinase/ActR/RegA family two-component response regulator
MNDNLNRQTDLILKIPMAVMIISKDLSVLAFNDGFKDRFTIGIGDPLISFIDDKSIQWFKTTFETLADSDGTYIGIGELDGNKVRFTLSKLDEETYICAVCDLNVVNKMEKMLQVAEEELSGVSIAKEKFFTKLSYSFRTPLNSIIGSLGLLSDTAVNGIQRQLIQQALDGSHQLISLINDMVTIPDITSGTMEKISNEFDLRLLVHDIVKMFKRHAIEKNIELNLSLDDRLHKRFKGNDKHIKQIMINLIRNAVQYTKEGSVQVKIMMVNDEKVNFIVEDTGIGIDKAVLDNINMTYTSDARSNGLGLIISRELVSNLGGELLIDSHVGLGTKVEFVIPIEKNETTHEDLMIESGLQVLIVEDDPINQKILDIRLKKVGITCDVAINGEISVDKCKVKKYDLILMDCQMPIMDGYEATKQIRALEGYQRVPIYALTAHAFHGEREKVIKAGMDEYFTKPLNFDKLMKKILGIKKESQ